jgi:hypothetical protein
MARRPSNSAVRLRRAQRALIDKLEPTLTEGYLESCRNVADEAIIRQVAEAIEKKDIEKALDLLNIEPAAFRPYISALEYAWEAGGNLAVNTMPKLTKRNA